VSEAIRVAIERCGSFLEGHRTLTSFPSDVTVWADVDALERVLENLISNAGKYSPAGTTVTVSARTEGENMLVSVDDEGPGIPPDHAARVFDRFYRVSSGDAAPAGTGIGLAAVHQLVSRMNGRVWVEARPTGGSSFRFALPCSPPRDEVPAIADEAPAAS
jgi:two-component system sensor histidine kinase KdpD